MPCHAMLCHLKGLSFFHFVGLLLEKHDGNSYDVHVFPAWWSSNSSRMHLLSFKCQPHHLQAKSEKKSEKNPYEQNVTKLYLIMQAP